MSISIFFFSPYGGKQRSLHPSITGFGSLIYESFCTRHNETIADLRREADLTGT